ncbi:hypothetical protein LTR27_008149 [Elasticomyces elasticus]|nr:hypothetical protein LTR27_008149 [Elasticomyces elasticus]
MDEAPKEFPDVVQKLSQPKKLSAFEKERQAADEKRRRAEAEDAAALKAFQDSFAEEDEDDDLSASVRSRGPPSGPRGRDYGGMGRGGGMRSGPGSMGGMGPPSLRRKRALDEMREAQEARRESSSYQSSREDRRIHEDDQEDEAPRPTVRLSNLPPDTTRETVEALLKGYLKVHSVQIIPPTGPGMAVKRSLTAIASLTTETATAQIDTAVSALKDRYLGCGFYLTISRHLSSSTLHPSMAGATSSSASSEPFGAERPREAPRGSMRNAPPPRGFGPPDSFDSPARGGYRGGPSQPEAVVVVEAPLDIATIRGIHVLVERLMSERDPQRALKMEALLMATPSVQMDERFAFLYDSRSPAGLYYRYLLWGPNDPSDRERRATGLERIHSDMPYEWAPPSAQVPFLDLTSLADVVGDIDYVSSDEESDDEGAERKFYNNRDAEGPVKENKKEHLNPVKRARLIHLLARLPTNNARLRKGDIARVTNFAINHAGQGAEEIVDLLLLNVEKPFAFTLAAKYEDSGSEEDEEYEPDDQLPSLGVSSPQPPKMKEQDDPSNAKLIALYVISDILSASSTAGARNAWKFRQLFEAGFKAQRTFERLGKLDRELAWGKLKGEQWKRRVGAIFAIWEGWSVFGSEVHETLRQSFLEPPLSEEEIRAEQQTKEAEEKKKQADKMKAKFKRVDVLEGGSASPAPAVGMADDVDGQPMDDIDGAPMFEDVDGAPMEDVDGAPMLEEDTDGAPMDAANGGIVDAEVANGAAPQKLLPPAKAHSLPGLTFTSAASVSKPVVPKKRMRAEDMFASDEE